MTCANRLKIVAQLRRFYLVEDARRPNLASQSLALSLRPLGNSFQTHHGFTPLLAESFHAPYKHTGILYKATDWQPLGPTKWSDQRHRQPNPPCRIGPGK